jgi:hypothetical protein
MPVLVTVALSSLIIACTVLIVMLCVKAYKEATQKKDDK